MQVTFPTSKYLRWKEPFPVESGGTLPEYTLAYETFGELDDGAKNAVLVFHALSGSARVTRTAEEFENDEGVRGWWERMVGPGRPIDTEQYFVVCANVLGSCYGSTGPASENPATGKPFALDFPILTVHDMVEAQLPLLDHMGIDRVLTVVGGSMGGMQALDFAFNHPERTASLIPLSTTPQSSAQNIAFHEVGRQAIMADPNWRGGKYYNHEPPNVGLSVARMVGHITYLSDASMRAKFGRRLQPNGGDTGRKHFGDQFAVESYLNYKGSSFTKRFDANSYLYITKAIDYFDLFADPRVIKAPKDRRHLWHGLKALVVSFTSDWLYPTYQSKRLVRFLKSVGVPAAFCEVQSDYGHDAFLLEVEHQGCLVSDFLSNLYAREVSK
ncbi:MAG: homoserine O-acetyltransferase [Promethearchaeota archaeon]